MKTLSEYHISSLGLGCASAWGMRWFDERAAISMVHRALDLGITVFDTGASYSGGNAEPRLGRALKGRSVDRLLISTKAGTHLTSSGSLYRNWAREALLEQIDRSRARLGLDTIPLLYLHGPRVVDLTPELFETLAEVRHRKWVRLIGVNSFDEDVLEALVESEFDVVMLDYNLTRIDRGPLLDRLHAAGKTVMGGMALANQLHAPGFMFPRSRADLWYLLRALARRRQELLRARKLHFLKHTPDWTPAQIAIAFATGNPKISSSIFGTTRREHLEENVAASSRTLPQSVIDAIRAAQEPLH
jgi:1-deoxyxylulose-5-phosphate synthase